MLFVIALAATAVAHLVGACLLIRSSRDRFEKLFIAIAMLALFAGMALTLVRIFIVPQEAWSDARLSTTTAILKGYTLYVRPGTGPFVCYMYGPFGALSYLPAAMISKSPTVDMVVGSALAAIYFFVPAAWLLKSMTPNASALARVLAFSCFAAFVHNSGTLGNTSAWIHSDPPALGLSACALAMVFRRDSSRNRFVVALLTATAIWTKQTLLPLLVVLPLIAMLIHGRRSAIRIAILMLAFVVVYGAIFVCFFDPRSMLFSMLIEPSRQPRGALPGVVKELGREIWPMLVLFIVALLARRKESNTSRPWLDRNRWCAALILAVALLPGGLVAWAKAGGSPNNAGLCTYFMLLATCALVAQCERPAFIAHRPDATRIGQLLLVLLAAEFSIHAAFADGLLALRVRLAMHPFNNGSELAYRFEKAHPGEAYFPWDPNAVLMASGKLYHFDYAAMDRAFANFPPTDEEVRAHVPPNMRWIAYPPQIVPSLKMGELLPGHGHRVELSELPGFLVFDTGQ